MIFVINHSIFSHPPRAFTKLYIHKFQRFLLDDF